MKVMLQSENAKGTGRN